MNHFSHSAGTAVDITAIPLQVLEEGEIIIIAIKPSLWLIPLATWPVALTAGVVAALTAVLSPDGPGTDTIYALSIAAIILKAGLATFNWLGRLYVLTNRRLMCFRGVLRPEMVHCPLKRVVDVRIICAFDEKLAGVGSLLFITPKKHTINLGWTCTSRPALLRQEILNAIARSG